MLRATLYIELATCMGALAAWIKHVSDHLSKLVENTWSDLGAGGDGGCNLQGGDQGSNQDKEAKHSYNYYKAYNYLRERREK
ncbi:hypothetical protein NC651_014648 [Populus alba x Populus x berolinensis]|nr:hypothetical protein NC651_014648 [Populus alba x Populus x berolinensis]